jgi:hypothetical protein
VECLRVIVILQHSTEQHQQNTNQPEQHTTDARLCQTNQIQLLAQQKQPIRSNEINRHFQSRTLQTP